jgi:hypothetical protein
MLRETSWGVQISGKSPRKLANREEFPGFSSSARVKCSSSAGKGERVMRGELNEPI